MDKNFGGYVFHHVRVATILMHPVAPKGCDKVREYLVVMKRIFELGSYLQALA